MVQVVLFELPRPHVKCQCMDHQGPRGRCRRQVTMMSVRLRDKKWISKCYNLALAMTGIESNGQALCLYVKGQICQISRSIAMLQRNWKTFTVVLYCLLCFQRRDQSWFLLRMEMVAGFLIRNAYLLPSARLPAPPPLITSLLSLSAPSLCWLPSSQHNISLPQLIPFLLQFGHFKISVLLLSRSSFTLQSLSRLALSLFSFC